MSVSPLSRHLISPDICTTPCSSKRAYPRARLLTSADSLQMLEEKERKKQEQLEEKERKKREREEKKRLKAEEMQKKAQERERKAAEREGKRQEKTMEKERRSKTSNIRTRGKHVTSSNSITSTSLLRETTTLASTSNSLTEPRASRNELSSRDEVIDPNVCCMCFVTYEDDVLEGARASWISCACGRWLHEDCAEDQIIDDDGNERNCSFCLDLLCC